MSTDLKGKRAIVTGGTRGIGRAIARALLEAGVDVAICGRSQQNVEQAVSELGSLTSQRIVGKTANVADASEVSAFFQFVEERLGGFDILVNNAGVGIFRSAGELSLDEWHSIIDTNLSGVFYCCREAIPRMKAQGGGFIVNVSSLAGKNPFAGGSAYNASKFGLNGFSEAMMMDHRHDNIRVSYIMPGSVDTEFGTKTEPAAWRIAPEDIAATVIHVLTMPGRTLISRVEMRPWRPPR